MKPDPKLAAVFRRAVDEHLWSGVGDMDRFESALSCIAVDSAVDLPSAAPIDWRRLERAQSTFFQRIEPGLTARHRAFDEFPAGPERQQARALWLTWCALMAAEGAL